MRKYILIIFYLLSNVIGYFWKQDNIKLNGKKNIVILHGWLAMNPALFLIKKRLEEDGYSVFLPDFGHHLIRIEKIAEKLDRYIKKHGIKDFMLIGHSLGGLIGLYYYYNFDNKIKKFISLGTPYKGVPLPPLFSHSRFQMRPGSSFLKELDKHKKKLRDFYSLFSKNDAIVDADSSVSKNMKNIHVDCDGHIDLLFSEKVYDKVLGIIEK